jgi:hypothetical protein
VALRRLIGIFPGGDLVAFVKTREPMSAALAIFHPTK